MRAYLPDLLAGLEPCGVVLDHLRPRRLGNCPQQRCVDSQTRTVEYPADSRRVGALRGSTAARPAAGDEITGCRSGSSKALPAGQRRRLHAAHRLPCAADTIITHTLANPHTGCVSARGAQGAMRPDDKRSMNISQTT